ncbi:Mucin-like protein [Exaiptasia diaphana]|nr:Mucin-like protein [Exaiptasia diaphana]
MYQEIHQTRRGMNGNFTEWSNWTSCSLSCGNGTRYRSRSCTNPAPAHGGKNCTGPYKETKNCNTQSCPVTLKNSVILRFHGSNQYWQDLSGFLSPVLQDASKSRWVRCWRAAFDGWNVTKTFHPKCDKQGPTVTIVRVGSYIFGGYSDVSWDSKYNCHVMLCNFLQDEGKEM